MKIAIIGTGKSGLSSKVIDSTDIPQIVIDENKWETPSQQELAGQICRIFEQCVKKKEI